MKILYIAPYKDGTGYAHSALDYIQSLHVAGADVTCRPTKLNTATPPIPAIVEELEKRPLRGSYDVVIQHTLPSFYDRNGKIPTNVGLYFTETDTVIPEWVDKINAMDRAIVANAESMEISHHSGVEIPIDIVHPACDIRKYQKMYRPLSMSNQLRDSFIFYTVGEFNKRKNLASLLQAFHLEFDPDDPVELMLKLSCPIPIRSDEEQIRFDNEVSDYCERLKSMMKIHADVNRYKKEILLTRRLSDADIMRVHTTGDVFISASHGEAWNLGAFDAMAMGKSPILSDVGGHREFMTPETGWLVPGYRTPVFGMDKNSPSELFNSRENWFQVDVASLRSTMRRAYENKEERRKKAAGGIKRAYDFSYEKIGEEFLEVLRNA